MEIKQHKDSVIARLMGLDEVPPQQTIHKRQRVLSENYLHKSASIGLREGSSFQIGKDVFDVHVSKKDEHNIFPVLDKESNSSTSKIQMGMGRKKNASATILKSTPGSSYNDEGIFNVKCKRHARGNVLRSLQKLEKDSLTGHFEELGFDPINKLKSRLERIDRPHIFSTSNVVLKPNSKMAIRNASYTRSDLLPRSGDRDHGESFEPEKGELLNELQYKDQAVNDTDSPRHSYSDCKEITSINSRQGRHGSSCSEASRPQFSVENYLMDERESFMASCPGFIECKDQKHAPYHFSYGSSLERESNKQIFEWWKRTKKVQVVESAGRGQNLGEMLAMADWELARRNMNLELDSLQGENLVSGCASGISSKVGWKNQDITGSPTSKVEVLRETFSNVGHLRQEKAASLNYNKLRKQNISQKDDFEHRGSRGDENFQSCLGTLKNDCTISQSPTSFGLSRCSVSWLASEINNPAAHEEVTMMIQDELENDPKMNDGSGDNEPDSRVPNSTIGNLASQNTVDILANAEAENIETSSSVYKQQQSEPNPGILSIKDRHFSSCVMETLTGQFNTHSSSRDWEELAGQVSPNEFFDEEAVSSKCLRIGPSELHRNLKGTNQCCPLSILEPFEEENSLTSEYLEGVTSNFYSHQLQLQLPKSELDETYSEGSGIGVISDSDTEKGFHDPSGGKVLKFFGEDESRDFSYLVDVLDEARFHGLSLEMDFETWNSLECPVSNSVFEALEKKYGKQKSWDKSQRQFLFDRINSGLRVIFNPYIHFHMSTPFRRRFSAKLTRDEVEEELWMLLINQEKEESKDFYEKSLGKEKKWLDLDEDIDIICRELENHLYDELALELVLC
ncbi:uncharacterized protein Fot_18426 [Forsythia ovata]|uniref:DUF4378 domain-containing protein n=1 Tax=Forsythia ovata TaxID=205694 RepID=A0ABD1VKW4_9LAMI